MATVNGWHGPFTMSIEKLIELLQQAPEGASIIVNSGYMSIVELNTEEWYQSEPIAIIDFTTEVYELTKPLKVKSIGDDSDDE